MTKEINELLEAVITREDLYEMFGNPYFQVADRGHYDHGGMWSCYQVWKIDGVYWEFDWFEDHLKGEISVNRDPLCLLRRVQPTQKLIWENYNP